MPTLWSHSMFWEQQAAQAMDREFLLVGVGRGAVISAVALGTDSLWPILLLAIGLLVQETLGKKIRQKIIKWVADDYSDLLAFFYSEDGLIARDALDAKAQFGFDRPMAETKTLELGYLNAQSRGSKIAGWKLRFALYYWLGRKEGLW